MMTTQTKTTNGNLRGVPRVGMSTPWGKADRVEQKARGVWFVSTPGHGGLKLRAKENKLIPEPFRRTGGWYEEDIDWAIVAYFFNHEHNPSLGLPTIPKECKFWVSDESLKAAEKSLKDYYPDQFTKVCGVPVTLEESYKLRERAFAEATKTKWVGVSASGDWAPNVPPGMVGVCATLGGSRLPEQWKAARYFLVPEEEYDKRRGPFVVPEDAKEVPTIDGRDPFMLR